jgi:hypothetical protein
MNCPKCGAEIETLVVNVQEALKAAGRVSLALIR